MTRVAALQLAPVVGDLAGNLHRTEEALAGVDADIIVLPELATSGYVVESAEELAGLAIRPDDAAFDAWARAAARRPGGVVIGGFAERTDDETVYNSAAVVTADGVQAVYRKVHLWDQEKRFFRPGDRPPAVVDTPHGRIGVLICYDLEFPEWTRTAALAGADLLAVPTNWPRIERPEGELPPELQIGIATARMNRMAVVCADRSGTERGVDWNEGSGIVDGEGWLRATVGPGTGAITVDLDLSTLRDKKAGPLADLFADRRPDLYGAVTDR